MRFAVAGVAAAGFFGPSEEFKVSLAKGLEVPGDVTSSGSVAIKEKVEVADFKEVSGTHVDLEGSGSFNLGKDGLDLSCSASTVGELMHDGKPFEFKDDSGEVVMTVGEFEMSEEFALRLVGTEFQVAYTFKKTKGPEKLPEEINFCLKDSLATLEALIPPEKADKLPAAEAAASAAIEGMHEPLASFESSFGMMVSGAAMAGKIESVEGDEYKFCKPGDDSTCVHFTVPDGALSNIHYEGKVGPPDADIDMSFNADFTDLTVEPDPIPADAICENPKSIADVKAMIEEMKEEAEAEAADAQDFHPEALLQDYQLKAMQKSLVLTHKLFTKTNKLSGATSLAATGAVAALLGALVVVGAARRASRRSAPADEGLLEDEEECAE